MRERAGGSRTQRTPRVRRPCSMRLLTCRWAAARGSCRSPVRALRGAPSTRVALCIGRGSQRCVSHGSATSRSARGHRRAGGLEPLRERLRAQQVVALYQAGRQAEALRAAGWLRKALRDELGLEPSRAMQDLERRVLGTGPGPPRHRRRIHDTPSGMDGGSAAVRRPRHPRTGSRPLTPRDSRRGWHSVRADRGTRRHRKSRFLSQIARRVVPGTPSFCRFTCTTCSVPRCRHRRAYHRGSHVASFRRRLRVIIDGVPDVPNDVAQLKRRRRPISSPVAHWMGAA